MGYGMRMGCVGAQKAVTVTNASAEFFASRTVCISWDEPQNTPRYDGVHIRYSSTGYPESSEDGTRLYEGAGVSVQMETDRTLSHAVCAGVCGGNKGPNEEDIFAAGTTYYFSIFSYFVDNDGITRLNKYRHAGCQWTAINKSMNDVLGIPYHKVVSSSETFTVPSDIHRVRFFVAGAGGSGGNRRSWYTGSSTSHVSGGGGGGGGNFEDRYFDVLPGSTISFNLGTKSTSTSADGNPSKIFGTLDGTIVANGGCGGSTSPSERPPGGYGGNGAGCGAAGGTREQSSSGGSTLDWPNRTPGGGGYYCSIDGAIYCAGGGCGHGSQGGTNAGHGSDRYDGSTHVYANTSATAGYAGGGGGGYYTSSSNPYSNGKLGADGTILYTWL